MKRDSLITAAIVDDDKDTVQVFAECLELIGVKVVARGYNGKAAVAVYKKHRPDVTFLDLMMPDHDGIYALRKIRAADPDAAVIIVTAYLDKQNAEALASLKPTEIIFKPFGVDDMSRAIQKLTKPGSAEFPIEKKALISFTITQALLKMGPSATNEVGSRLYSKYKCYFSDCLEHPEYLSDILTQIFGTGARAVTDSIRQSLEEFKDQRAISGFLATLPR